MLNRKIKYISSPLYGVILGASKDRLILCGSQGQGIAILFLELLKFKISKQFCSSRVVLLDQVLTIILCGFHGPGIAQLSRTRDCTVILYGFEYHQHMFWLRNKKNIFSVTHSFLGASYLHVQADIPW